MGQAYQHHLGGSDRAARRFDFGDALEQHLPVARQHPYREILCEFGPALALGLGQGRVGCGIRHQLEPRHQMRETGEFAQDRGGIGAGAVLIGQERKALHDIAAHHRLEQIDHPGAIGQPEHVAHRVGRDRAGAVGNRLIEQRERITDRALGGAGDRGQRLGIGGDPFEAADPREMRHQPVGAHPAQIEALAARQDGDGNLVDIRRGEDEFRMRRRLFQRLQEGVERAPREHVHLVDDIDLVARRDRRIAHGIVDLADILDAVVGGGVDFHHVDMAALDDRLAMLARLGQIDGGAVVMAGALIIQAARENARRGGLADTAHAGEHPGLGDAPGAKRVRERTHHGLLADEIVKIARAVLAGKDAVAGGIVAARRREPGERRLGFAGRICHAGLEFVHAPIGHEARAGLKPKPFRPPNPPGKQVGGWTRTRSVSLGLLPSGPDPVGE